MAKKCWTTFLNWFNGFATFLIFTSFISFSHDGCETTKEQFFPGYLFLAFSLDLLFSAFIGFIDEDHSLNGSLIVHSLFKVTFASYLIIARLIDGENAKIKLKSYCTLSAFTDMWPNRIAVIYALYSVAILFLLHAPEGIRRNERTNEKGGSSERSSESSPLVERVPRLAPTDHEWPHYKPMYPLNRPSYVEKTVGIDPLSSGWMQHYDNIRNESQISNYI